MKIYYMNSSHWDREWFLPFQGFRFNLVDMIDDLLDIMENDPEYKLFCFDGQTIVLEDYAEVVPEGAERLRKLIDQGRLKIGPWYVMPDEFLVSGESLIRNLMVGHAISPKWGAEPWKYGYVNDVFGHIAQMPQIFNDFGINGAYLGRGLGSAKFSHFVWEAPNGAKCYASIGSYSALARSRIKKFGTEEFPELLKKHIETLASKSDAPIVILSNTDDHAKATPQTPQVLKMITELLPEAEVVDADLSFVAQELEKYETCLPIVCGELNEPNAGGNAKLLYHCLSSYYPLKQENDRCQNMLEKRIEPMLAVAAIEKQPIRHSFVDVAYRHLLENHPHDSICGCSGDQVHKDMIYRYDQVKQICDRLYDRFLEFNPQGTADEYELKLYNFTPFPQKRIRTAKIDFFKDYPTEQFGYALKESRNNFKLYNERNQEISYQILSIERNVKKRILTEFQKQECFDIYSISFEADIPAFGFATYKVVPCKEIAAYVGYLPCGDSWAENDYIRLDIRPNGQLDITDKRTGRTYRKLHEFSDNAEVGDGWRHESPINGYTTSGYGCQATISRIHCGFASVAFKIEKELLLPACLNDVSFTRSDEKKRLHIEYTVSLRRDSAAVEIETKIDNNIKDHRLRLMLPTGVDGDMYFAGQAFYRVERKTGIAPEAILWPEPECPEKNMNGIIGKTDKNGIGLAFVSAEGLHEGAVHNDNDNTIAITLYRCFDRVYLQTKAERSQLQQELTFKYAIVPLDEGTDYAQLLQFQHYLSDADIAVSRRLAEGDALIFKKSYFEIDNRQVQVSIFKCAQDGNGYILRLYNVSDNPVQANVTLGFGCQCCYGTNMNEENRMEIPVIDEKVNLSFKPWEIKTLRFC